jgi:hypothetical protein
MKFLVLIYIILIQGAFVSDLSAQNFYREKYSRDNIFSFGTGPSFAYLDNGGSYRNLNFAINPAISISLTKKIKPLIELRTTAGVQWITSGGNPSPGLIDNWISESASVTVDGPVYFLDFTPNFYLIPFSNHMHRPTVNLYGGAGLGIMNAVTKQTKSTNPEELRSTKKISTGYSPVRVGLSLKIGPYSDIAGEGTILWTFSDTIDGNSGFNRYGDHLFQAQIVFRGYFSPKATD